MSRFNRALCLALCLALVSCGKSKAPEPPQDVLGAEQMTAVLVEMHLVEGARSGTDILGDSLKFEDYQASVFKRNGLTAEDWGRSFAWYSRHPELLEPLYDAVIERLSTMEVKGGAPPQLKLGSKDTSSSPRRNQEP